MSELKLTRGLGFLTMKNDAKSGKELTCQFKIDMRNLKNFDPSTQKSRKIALLWAAFDKAYNFLA